MQGHCMRAYPAHPVGSLLAGSQVEEDPDQVGLLMDRDGFHMTAAGYEAVARSWKEANLFDGRKQVTEDIPVEVGRLNAWLPS